MIYLLCCIVALQLADIATTYLSIKRGKAKEGFKPTAWLMAHIGLLPALLISKGAFIVLLLWAAPQSPIWILTFVAGWYLPVIFNNYKVLAK